MVYYSSNRYNEVMFLVGFISWWYGRGWAQYIQSVKNHLMRTIDFFSITVLAQTLFAPFRQISAGKVDGSLSVIVGALVDKLISRVIGFIIRSVVLVVGLIVIIVQLIISVVLVIFWGLIPILPVAGLILATIGWAPAWQ